MLRSPEGELIERFSRYLGRVTNNEAEYLAIELGLEAAVRREANVIRCYEDSGLACRQLNGQYKVSNPRLKTIHARIRALADRHDVDFQHIARELNQEADRLAAEAILSQSKSV